MMEELRNDGEENTFGWADYLVFVLMLVASAAIGVYYACVGRKKTSTDEFLMAGRNMGTFPVAMSLIASFMSAITLLGTPAEIYQFGTIYWLIIFSFFFVMPAANFLYMPIFYNLQCTSAYEYLELRFSKTVRCMGSLTFTLQMCLYMSVVVYAPALALSQVTGINVWISVSSIFVICIFYTVIGGLKAVIWTDTLQVVIMYVALLIPIIQGDIDVGGAAEVWRRNYESGRVEFDDWDFSPGKRHSVWSLIIGGYFTWVTIYGVNQSQVQRYLTVATIRQARYAIWINLVGLVVLFSICCYGGMVIYAKYYLCDPLSAKYVNTPDQLFPLFVLETMGHVPGITGFFVAGIFSGALSTVSSGLNSLAAIFLEDFVRPFWLPNMEEAKATLISKMLALGFGVLCFGLVFVAANLGNVLEAALSIFGIIGGPLLGVFTLGMFFPWANAKGAGVGIISSLVLMLWIGIGTQVAKGAGYLKVESKPYNNTGCVPPLNSTITVEPDGEALSLYELSYMWYSATGCATVVVVGLIVSVLTGMQDPRKLNPALICNTGSNIFWFLPKGAKEFLRFHVGDDYNPEKEESTTSSSTTEEVPPPIISTKETDNIYVIS